MLAGEALDDIREKLSGLDAAVYERHEMTGGLHCELVLYFSPAASTLARSLGAVLC